MKFTVEANELKRVMSIIEIISKDAMSMKSNSSSNTQIEALFYVKKNKLVLQSTEEGLFYIRASCSAEVDSQGKSIIDISNLQKFNFRSNKVTLEEKGNRLLVSCGRLRSQISAKTGDAVDEKLEKESKSDEFIVLPCKELSEVRDWVIFSSIDSEIENSLPFVLSVKDKEVYATSNDHFCLSMMKVGNFKGKVKLNDLKYLPEGILSQVLSRTLDKDVSIGFGQEQFIIKTSDITLKYPQPQYTIADVHEAISGLRSQKSELSFVFNPSDLYNAIDEVASVIDDSETTIVLEIKKSKLYVSASGNRGKAKSFTNISKTKGKKKTFSAIYNIFSSFIGHITSEEECKLNISNDVILFEVRKGEVTYAIPVAEYEGDNE